MMTAEQLYRIKQDNMEYYGFGPEAMKKLKVCEHCGTAASADRKFCKECGRRLPKETIYQKYKEMHRCCPVCETVLTDTMQYCPQCGKRAEEK